MSEKKRTRTENDSQPDNKESKREEKKPKEAQQVSIVKLELKKEFVTILNHTAQDVDVSEWKLLSVKGSQTFPFPKGTILKGGCSMNIWSGKDSHKRNHPPNGSFAWTEKFIWNDKGDTAQLVNKEGKVVDEKEDHPLVHDGTISIEHLDLEGEYVTILNSGHENQNISGWILKSLVGKQSFTFPKDSEIKSGCTVVIWSGKEADHKEHHPISFHWVNKNIWNNSGDVAALYNHEGNLVCSQREFPDKIPHHINVEQHHKH